MPEVGIKVKGVELRVDLQMLVDERLKDNQFVASRILPEVMVQTESGNYKTLREGVGNKLVDTARSSNGTFHRGNYNLAEDSFKTAQYGWETPAEKTESILLAPYLDIEVLSAEISANQVMIAREKRVADAVFNTTTFTGADYTAVPTGKWNTSGTTIRADIRNAALKFRKRLGVPQSMLSFVANYQLIDNIIDQMVDDNAAIYNTQLKFQAREIQLNALREYLKVGEVIETNTIYDSINLDDGNADASFTEMWDTSKALLCIPSNTSQLMKGGLGRQPVYAPWSRNMTIDSYTDKRTLTTYYRAIEYRGTFVDKKYGFLFTGVLA